MSLFIGTAGFARTIVYQTQIKGSVENSSFDKVTIKTINDRPIHTATVDSNGDFNLKAPLDTSFYLLEYGRESIYVHLDAKDRLEIYFDASDLEGTLQFKGVGAQKNKYLSKKARLTKEIIKEVEVFYDVDENKFLENISNLKTRLQKELSEYNVKQSFIKQEEKSLQFNYLFSIQNFQNIYKYNLGKEINPSNAFYEELKGIDLENMSDYKTQPYYYYLVNSIWSKRIEAEDGFENMDNKFREISNNEVLNSIFIGFYSKITRNKDTAEDYYNLIKKYSTSEEFVTAAKEKLDSLFLIHKGDVSPSFTYEDIDGNKVSLEDFKGKLIYIDVWATWCAPCKKQIPYLKKLEEYFRKEDIVFISISVDDEKAYNSWKNMVESESLEGVQLFADNSFDSKFMEAYGISSIPRFIIIDQEGKVYDEQAPSPSFDKTKVLLESLLE
jgi:thiol-disulfide isomerase/thioredoxin